MSRWIVGLGPSDTWTVLDDVPPRGAIAGHIQRAEDARLIAAAPELLEAAKFALTVAESWIPDLYREGRPCELALKGLDPTRRAIAKATGESLPLVSLEDR